MKVRWKENSLRLRITPSELSCLERGEAVTETLALPGGWELCLTPLTATTALASSAGRVVVYLCEADLHHLAEPETEGVYFQQDDFCYFIEKDFPCAHPRPKEAVETTEHFSPPRDFALRHRCPL